MSSSFKGIIIEESLEKKLVLKKVKILLRQTEEVTPGHKTPWVKKWTLCTVEVPESFARRVADELSRSLDSKHSWYADFKNDTHAYIIFRNKVFYVSRGNQQEHDEARKYGISLGIPEYQLDFKAD